MQPDNYIAFGLSGSVNRVQMVRGDVTWTWLDSEGVHAQDLDLSAYAQVSKHIWHRMYSLHLDKVSCK